MRRQRFVQVPARLQWFYDRTRGQKQRHAAHLFPFPTFGRYAVGMSKQFNIRSMLVVVAVLCVALALWVVPLERRRQAVAAIEALGGKVSYLHFPTASESLIPQSYLDDIYYVDFYGTKITDRELAELKSISSVQELRLQQTHVTDDGLAHLKGLTRLTTLDLAGCSQIEDAGLIHLPLPMTYAFPSGR
jgi:hypothetical protein